MENAEAAGRGSLRTYLGTAPGVGKTFAMLDEGRRRARDGEKVVIGWLEPQDRAETSRLAGGLDCWSCTSGSRTAWPAAPPRIWPGARS